ncbi:MAG: PEGA domain-containing protein [Thermoanaerobaculia bacterium]|nr:PEGA domain-containing protein [Thermoanaerobaculia bacterium]
MNRYQNQQKSLRSHSSIRIPLLVLLVCIVGVPFTASADEPRSRSEVRTSETATETSRSAPSTRSATSQSAERTRGGTESRTRIRRRTPDGDSDAGDRRHYRRHRFSPWYRSHSYWSWGWGGWGWAFGPGFVVIHDRDPGRGYGALDLDVRPEEAEVWVDGRRVGIADNYDGFPTYLWLPSGDYEVVFYHPGYRTIHREYAIFDGMIIDVEDAMVRGEATPPEDLLDRPTPRRDARIERNRKRRLEVQRDREERSWRQRETDARREQDRARYSERDRTVRDSEPGGEERWRERERNVLPAEEPRGDASIRLRVAPGDASVYLDGSFLGLAREIGELSLEPGDHRLEVVRPGYEAHTEELEFEPGEVMELEIELEED